MTKLRGMLIAVVLLTGVPGAVCAQSVTREEALASAYPGASIRSEQLFLTPGQWQQVTTASGSDAGSAFVVRYLATKDGQPMGRAYLDTHSVRTKKASLLVMLEPNGQVKRIEVVAFMEPAEFLPPGPWLRQYNGRTLTPDLAINRAIRPIAGATLTSRATNAAVRRVLAVDQVAQASASGSQR